MSKLGQLLSYLDGPDVGELVFRSGEPVMMHSGSRSHPVTVIPLESPQIRRFFEGTPVIELLPSGPAGPARCDRLTLLGMPYRVTVGGTMAVFEIRVSTDREPPAARSSPAQPAGTSLEASSTPPNSGRSGGWASAPTRREVPSATVPSRVPPGTTRREMPAATTRREQSVAEVSRPEPTAPPLQIERNDDATLHQGREIPSFGERAIPLPSEESGPFHGFEDHHTDLPPPPPHGALSPAASTAEPDAPVIRTPPASSSHRADSGPVLTVHPALLEILVAARNSHASDVHIMSDGPVRMRRAAALEPWGSPIASRDVRAMLGTLLSPKHAQALGELGYTDFAADLGPAGRLRINVNRQRTGLKACFRLVASQPPTVAKLALPTEVRGLATHHQGMVIVSGPSGHGKTTTMAALVDMLNSGKSLHIITVEDPVEVIHPPKRALVTQREVGTHTRSFATALAAALREDPDVIAIGELRDRETVEMALAAAETGHLVIATMSTPSGAKTIDRVIDMFPPDDQSQVRATLAGALKLVISQRLLRRADGHGLVGAFELITGNIPLWSLIRDNKLFQLPSLLQRGRNYGMIRLEDSLRELIAAGLVTREEALVHADDPRALRAPDASVPPPPTASPTASGWRFGKGR